MKDLTHIVRMALAIALLPTAFNVVAAETEHREHGPHEHALQTPEGRQPGHVEESLTPSEDDSPRQHDEHHHREHGAQ